MLDAAGVRSSFVAVSSSTSFLSQVLCSEGSNARQKEMWRYHRQERGGKHSPNKNSYARCQPGLGTRPYLENPKRPVEIGTGNLN
eukprot:4850338-Amphidinium_carterae.1